MKNLLELDYVDNVLDELSDEKLAVKARADKHAEALIISRYLRIIWNKSDMYANSLTDSADLVQEGLLGLLSAVEAFNPEKNIRFSTFANVCITNRMKTLVAKTSRLDAPVEDIEELSVRQGLSFSETPETIFIFKQYYSELFKKIDSVLTDKENTVFQMYINEMSYKDIAEKLKISEKSVDNAIQRARRKIKQILKSAEK